MGTAYTPREISSTVQASAPGLKHHSDRSSAQHWARNLAAGSLIAGAVLLVSGKRKAGLVVTAAGTITALLEDPDSVSAVWSSIPEYLKTGQQMLQGFEKFIEDLAAQGDKVRALLAKATES